MANNNQKLVHWADQTAEKIIRERGDLDLYTCASGITPSGTVHIGNFREIISVDLVVRALRSRGKNVRFIYSWDDYDVFRKVPVNMPDQDVLENHLRFPITMVPDTTGRDSSYARHHEVDVEEQLPRVGIHPEYLYQAERYRKNMYAEGMKIALQNREKIKDCLNRYRDDAHKIPADEEYWPTAAFCCKCNKDTTEMVSYDGEYGLTYRCTSCGHEENADLRTSKEIKLGWRVDWPMRWQFEKTLFEPAGKDHHSQGGSFDTARLVADEIYNWPAPVTFRYDFIGIKGTPGKMSSSKGKVISLPDVLNVYPPEIVRYLFAGTRPNTEFSISFDLDVIKTYEDYDKTERIAWGVDKAKNDDVFAKEYRIYELSQVEEKMPSSMAYQIPFRHLCNLLQTNSGDIEAVVASQKDIKPDQVERFRTRCKCAWYWITECAPEDFRFALNNPDSENFVKAEVGEKELECIKRIYSEILPKMDELEEKPLSEAVYGVATDAGIEPKALFNATYQILISKDQGPRLANFMKIIGKERLEKIFKVYC
ncbi:MAG: lysine--tRNA ligase [Spirochaetaceae bacterium]|nr:lysine--tRNA ligase [Spirochaetaceae bacterium]MBQ3024701.1 lysine--tRNA ligase [Spirochaetaceae bacterium]MBQ7906228.1 lysine--tRNA ligase [Spirochaetaceae bacterium]